MSRRSLLNKQWTRTEVINHERRSRLTIAKSLLIALMVLFPGGFVRGAELPTDRQAFREELKRLWTSVQSIEFECDEFALTDQGEPINKMNFVRNEFFHQKESMWAGNIRIFKNGQLDHSVNDVRSNGQSRFQLQAFRRFPAEISDLDIKNQVSTPDGYEDFMFSALWLYLPGGRPIYTYLDANARLESAPEYGPSCVRVEASYRDYPLRLILDGEREWLPRRVELAVPGDPSFHETIQFSREHDRWFPAHGRYSGHTPSGTVIKSFRVSRFAINRPIAPQRFQPPPIPDGVRISNDVTGRVEFRGGRDAYLRRFTKYATPLNQGLVPAQPIVALESAPPSPWMGYLIATSSSSLLIGVALWTRRRWTSAR